MRRQRYRLLSERNTLLFLGAFTLVLGIQLSNPILIQIAITCFAAVTVALVQTISVLNDVNGEREHPARAFQGSKLVVSLRIFGTEGPAAELVCVEEDFPVSSAGKVRRLIEFPLRKGRVAQIRYMGSCVHRRGAYVLGPVKLETCDAFGFFRKEMILEVFSSLTVYPVAVDLHKTRLLGEGVLTHAGLEIKPRTGVSEEFYGIREYRHGDPPRLIDWKSTARQNRLMVKEFEEEITTLVTFFLDLSKLGLSGIGDQTSVEYSIRCCASLARRAVDLGHRIQYFGVASKIDHVAPGMGIDHLLTILDRLAFARPEGKYKFPVIVHDFAPQLPAGSTAVMLVGASTLDPETIEPPLSVLIFRKILPIFVLVDDRAFIKLYRDQEMRHHQGVPLDEMAHYLQSRGARVHVLRREDKMERALLRCLEEEEGVGIR